MKILKTLQSILCKMDKSEINQFRAYVVYKNEKKLLELFDILLKHKKAKEEYLKIYLQEKNVDRNLHRICKKLHQFLINFWMDENEPDKRLEINRLMYGASTLMKKGLPQESIELLEKTLQIAKTYEEHDLHLEIIRLLVAWDNKFKNSKELLQSIQEQANLIKEKLSADFDSNILSAKVYYSIFNCNWAFTEKDKQYFVKCEEETNELLQLETCPVQTQFLCYSILFWINSYQPNGDKKLMEIYLLKCIELAKSLYEVEPIYYGPRLIFKIGDLLILHYLDNDKTNFLQSLDTLNEYLPTQIKTNPFLQYNVIYAEFLKCKLLKAYSIAEEEVIPNTIKYLDKNPDMVVINSSSLLGHAFEIKISVGKWEEAEFFLEKLIQKEYTDKLPRLLNFRHRLYVLLYNFEIKNYTFVENNAKSTRRLYSDLIKGNPGAKLFLQYIIRLSKATDTRNRLKLFKSFKTELLEVFDNHFYRRIVGIGILSDWLDAKVDGANSIQDFFAKSLHKST